MYYSRMIEKVLLEDLEQFPVVALLGPRQCGKTTLAAHLAEVSVARPNLYLDLERPSDLRKLEDAEWFLGNYRDYMICIDEIQRKAELFPLLRSLSDEWKGSGHFLILGSASGELLRQSSESLAGRISYHYLRPFILPETAGEYRQEEMLLKGGFPRSLFSKSLNLSQRWRESFITTFIERDLFQWKSLKPRTMQRLLEMLAHVNGQLLNYASLANSLGVSSMTVRNYIDVLSGAFLTELLPPFQANTGKRISKSPKFYMTDTGLVTALLNIQSMDQLFGHPALGALWEGFVLHHLRVRFPALRISYYRTSHGAELDFILEYGGQVVAVECKASVSPNLSKGNYLSLEDTRAARLLVIAPVQSGWRIKDTIYVTSLAEAMDSIADLLHL